VTAFSRLETKKLYVQHRLRDHGAQVDALLQQGAFVYVCGDAARMAAAVELALKQVIAERRLIDMITADHIINEMKASGQYQVWTFEFP
jgi:NADPH-ferrihemoprotein reductase